MKSIMLFLLNTYLTLYSASIYISTLLLLYIARYTLSWNLPIHCQNEHGKGVTLAYLIYCCTTTAPSCNGLRKWLRECGADSQFIYFCIHDDMWRYESYIDLLNGTELYSGNNLLFGSVKLQDVLHNKKIINSTIRDYQIPNAVVN
jgi:hypothetical protein